MTSIHAILIVIIRLWAAGVVISSISNMLMLLHSIFNSTVDSDTQFLYYLSALIWLAAGGLAWFAAPWLARRVYPKADHDDLRLTVNAETLVAIGGFLIGAFYLVEYGSRLVFDIGRWFVWRANAAPLDELLSGPLTRDAFVWDGLLSNLLVVLLAAWIMLRPAYLARIFTWLRHAGQYDPKNEK